ncbi:MAG: LysM peptidoglycan-binding domain-containing protein [Labilithrix sp.]|nr:LysM peptidoglycan-binding domain-containing protein [Labilithrix sp.]
MRTRAALLFVASLAFVAGDASAFPHVVSQGETLAQIAIKFYGSPRFETALVGANALDAHGGSAIVAGQPLEIPSPTHHRVTAGETWADLSRLHLGDAKRAETLARANGGVSWIQPAVGQEIEVPAVVAHIASENETMPGLAQRYLGDMNRAWELDGYNGRKGDQKLLRGDVVLVPLLDLALTEEGKKAARLAAERIRTEGGGRAYEAQRRAEADIPPLLADVRAGRYVDAVAKGNRLLGSGDLTKPQLSTIHRALVEAYVALEATGLASGACAAWRANAPDVRLDPKTVSPKIRAACGAR